MLVKCFFPRQNRFSPWSCQTSVRLITSSGSPMKSRFINKNITSVMLGNGFHCLFLSNGIFCNSTYFSTHPLKKLTSLNLSVFIFINDGNTQAGTDAFNKDIVKILNLFIILLCTHLYHTSLWYLSITCNAFIACYILNLEF